MKEMNGKHLSKELEMFEAIRANTKNIKLLFKSLKQYFNFHRISGYFFLCEDSLLQKTKTQLNDRNIDHLCILKLYKRNV